MIFYFAETQLGQKDNLSAMQSILEDSTLDHNISSFIHSRFTICYKSAIIAPFYFSTIF